MVFCFPVKGEECCESQGGISGEYTEEGYAICKDETPTYNELCRKQGSSNKPSSNNHAFKKGCTNQSAKNYDATAQVDDGSCIYYLYGCTDKESVNYNSQAEKDDGSCKPKILGCMNPEATNYHKDANAEDGSCLFSALITEEKTLYFKTRYQEDKNLLDSEEKIMTKGVTGLSKVQYRIITDSHGKEVFRQKIREDVIKPAQPELVALGTRNTFKNISKVLYTVNMFLFVFLYFYNQYSHNSAYYLIKSIATFSYTPKYFPELCYFIIKFFLYFLYYITIIPIYIDFFTFLQNHFFSRFLD